MVDDLVAPGKPETGSPTPPLATLLAVAPTATSRSDPDAAATERIEGQTYFPALLTRFPHLRLDPGAAAPRFRDDPLLRGLQAPHVHVDQA